MKNQKTLRLKKIKIGIGAVMLLCTSINVNAQKTTVKGNIAGLEDTKIIFSYLAEGEATRDSVVSQAGRFTWESEISEPQKVYILFPNRAVQFFAEPGTIKITGIADSLHRLTFSGSETQAESDAYEKSLQDITDQERRLYQKYGKVDEAEQLALEEKLQELREEKRARGRQYIAKHPNSALSVSLVADRALMGKYQDVQTLYDMLGKVARESGAGQQLNERLAVLKRSDIGEQILNFTQNDTEGNPVQFDDFKGKYVLVDFWASWCGPCRAENPNVLKAYNTYKDQNFTVIGVSLDDNAENWKKAIEEDNMPWTQVSDLKGFKNAVSSYYGIQAIPSSLLVDPEGKIIDKDLRGELLNKRLNEIFN